MADELQAGLWHEGLALNDGERVLYAKRANRTAGRRAVGGRLIATDERIAFVPNRFEKRATADLNLVDGGWVTERDNVDDVRLAPRRIGLSTIFSGEWRTGVLVSVKSGVDQRFLVPQATEASAEILAALAGSGDGGSPPQAERRASGR